MSLRTELLPGTERLLSLHRRELPQKDDLCGAFWGTLMLGAAGVDLDQDAVAVAAGTLISGESRAQDRPPGAAARRDYRLPIPLAEEVSLAGTSATGLARAVEALSEGRQAVLPVAGPWVPEMIRVLMAAAADAGPGATVIANVGTRFFWPSRIPLDDLVRYLEHEDDGLPASDWDVGHFVGLLGTVTGERGTAVIVADTYPELGHYGVHVQPVPRVLAALERPGQHRGGVLLSVAASERAAAAARLQEAGALLALWDNGSESPAVVEPA